MPHTFAYLRYHVIWTTKENLQHLDKRWRDDLFHYMGGIMRHKGGVLLAAGGVDDHLHALLSCPADMSVAHAVNVLKSNSSRWICGSQPVGSMFGWQEGYGVFTVSASRERKSVEYIRSQEEHHRRVSYLEELDALLRRHGMKGVITIPRQSGNAAASD